MIDVKNSTVKVHVHYLILKIIKEIAITKNAGKNWLYGILLFLVINVISFSLFRSHLNGRHIYTHQKFRENLTFDI